MNLWFGYIFLCTSFFCTNLKSESMTLADGFYFGRNRGFFPQNIVYVKINKDIALVECYLPLKGQFFYTFSDKLVSKNEGSGMLYSSEKGVIYSTNKGVFFKTIPGRSDYNIRKTRITLNPGKESEYDLIKKQAKPFKE